MTRVATNIDFHISHLCYERSDDVLEEGMNCLIVGISRIYRMDPTRHPKQHGLTEFGLGSPQQNHATFSQRCVRAGISRTAWDLLSYPGSIHTRHFETAESSYPSPVKVYIRTSLNGIIWDE